MLRCTAARLCQGCLYHAEFVCATPMLPMLRCTVDYAMLSPLLSPRRCCRTRCTWRKIFIPYCTGDMHSGQQTERNPSLGDFYFAGHLQIKGVVADIKDGAGRGGKYSPTHGAQPTCSTI